MSLVAARGGDHVKLFDVSKDPGINRDLQKDRTTPRADSIQKQRVAASEANDEKESNPLLDAYLKRDEAEKNATPSTCKVAEAVKGAHDVKGTDDVDMSNDGKLVLDFLKANATTEKRQADLDVHIYFEEKRMMKPWRLDPSFATDIECTHHGLSVPIFISVLFFGDRILETHDRRVLFMTLTFPSAGFELRVFDSEFSLVEYFESDNKLESKASSFSDEVSICFYAIKMVVISVVRGCDDSLCNRFELKRSRDGFAMLYRSICAQRLCKRKVVGVGLHKDDARKECGSMRGDEVIRRMKFVWVQVHVARCKADFTYMGGCRLLMFLQERGDVSGA
nr:MICOS complex subunit MIC60 [Tanacetum cinerariifolium]